MPISGYQGRLLRFFLNKQILSKGKALFMQHLTKSRFMNKQKLQLLIDKYLNGESTVQEEKYLIDFFDSYRADKEVWNTEALGDIAQFNQRLYKGIHSKLGLEKGNSKLVKSPLFNRFFKMAAMVIVVLSLSLTIYYYVKQNDVTIKSQLITWNEKKTDRGEKLTFRLSDGTVVKLNSKSKLRFPNTFNDKKREVVLEGEAFFEVVKDSNRPFVILTNNISTTVLGTSFNINAYPKSNLVEVAVVTGKVKVESTLSNNKSNTPNAVYLFPNKKASYNKGENLLITSSFVNGHETGWKDGIIYFNNASEKDVIERLERWYGVDIEVENKSSAQWDLIASFNNQSLEEVMLSLSHTANFTYTINNKKVFITYL